MAVHGRALPPVIALRRPEVVAVEPDAPRRERPGRACRQAEANEQVRPARNVVARRLGQREARGRDRSRVCGLLTGEGSMGGNELLDGLANDVGSLGTSVGGDLVDRPEVIAVDAHAEERHGVTSPGTDVISVVRTIIGAAETPLRMQGEKSCGAESPHFTGPWLAAPRSATLVPCCPTSSRCWQGGATARRPWGLGGGNGCRSWTAGAASWASTAQGDRPQPGLAGGLTGRASSGLRSLI